ncbi:MAG: hypothetical protein AAF902_13330 [Chloroflexota bacterium]
MTRSSVKNLSRTAVDDPPIGAADAEIVSDNVIPLLPPVLGPTLIC